MRKASLATAALSAVLALLGVPLPVGAWLR